MLWDLNSLEALLQDLTVQILNLEHLLRFGDKDILRDAL